MNSIGPMASGTHGKAGFAGWRLALVSHGAIGDSLRPAMRLSGCYSVPPLSRRILPISYCRPRSHVLLHADKFLINRGANNMGQFGSKKRRGDKIKSATAYRLDIKPNIYDPGNHDDRQVIPDLLRQSEHVSPAAVWQIASCENDINPHLTFQQS